MCFIAGILILGLTGNLGLNHKELTFPEFERAYKAGRILNEPELMPIQVTLSENATDGVISAYMADDSVKPELTYVPFSLPFNTGLIDNTFKQRLDELGVIQPTQSQPLPPFAGNPISTEEFNTLVTQGLITGANGTGKPQLFYDGDRGLLVGNIVQRTWNKTPLDLKRSAIPVDVRFNQSFDGGRIQSLLGSKATYGTDSNYWHSFFVYFLPVLIMVFILFLFLRSSMGGGGANSALSFGKSRARLITPDKNKVTFKDVAGVNEAKEEVWEIVEFLKNPTKFRDLGGKIPKGVLLVGSPGTGKTLLAKAIAGEADVPFFSISGSDFVEMFVGVGASRVRDMFEEAKKAAPCLIFIDEIDAVGRHRGFGVGGGHDEREQTLNALLVEMDGFNENENVIVIAATNRVDVLDPALLRPGRFDREVTVNLPDVVGREQILMVHAKKVKLAKDVNLEPIARGTAGFSGAELANLINESALIAARKGLTEITNVELEEARDKVRWGKERRSLTISDKDKHITAIHEAGHAICLLKTEHSEPLHKVTIIPRGAALGATMWLPAEDRYHMRQSEMKDSLIVAMGGRCAEQIVFNDVTSGAVGDIRMATKLARRMVCEFGMSDKLGLIEYGEENGEVFLARDLGTRSRNYSDKTAELIDNEVRELVDKAYEQCHEILVSNLEALKTIAQALMDYETLDGDQVKDLLEQGFMSHPPKKTTPPPLDEQASTTPANSEAQKAEPEVSKDGESGEISESPVPELVKPSEGAGQFDPENPFGDKH